MTPTKVKELGIKSALPTYVHCGTLSPNFRPLRSAVFKILHILRLPH